jgi:hypothetical protein
MEVYLKEKKKKSVESFATKETISLILLPNLRIY